MPIDGSDKKVTAAPQFRDLRLADFVLRVLPLPVAVVDTEVKVQAVNPAAECFFRAPAADAYQQKCGDMLRCVNASQPGGCGGTPACRACVLRSSVGQALEGQSISRRKGKFTIWQDSELHQLTLLITAAPARYQRKPVAIVIVEDISLISELSGLLPICSSCHKIRDDQGEWIPVERYIREKSEAEFTHDYCPTCTAALRRSEPR